MAKPQTITGRIIAANDGSFVDKITGKLVTFSPSFTILEDGSYEKYKVKVERNIYDLFVDKVGLESVTVLGAIEKGPQPAVMQAYEFSSVTPKK